MNDHEQGPDWLDEFEDMANEHLTEGSACKQIHPIVEQWYDELMDGEPPVSRDSVLQAIACLSTEIIFDMPDELLDAFTIGDGDDNELALWVQEILMIGRAFQIALNQGELDDL